MNKHLIIGNVGNQPEIKRNETTTIAKFSIATNRFKKDAFGERQKLTDWLNVTAFGKTAELIEKYIDTGSKVAIVGRVSTSYYQTESGETKYFTETIIDEIEFLSSNKGNSGHQEDDLPS